MYLNSMETSGFKFAQDDMEAVVIEININLLMFSVIDGEDGLSK